MPWLTVSMCRGPTITPLLVPAGVSAWKRCTRKRSVVERVTIFRLNTVVVSLASSTGQQIDVSAHRFLGEARHFLFRAGDRADILPA
jgi:hypothetical protein